ncbi:unnamed protein product [Arabis nemorensis]|uniref:Uncharacterized protein n=1 Tax=Arabis nemorensis TaxID=586526 RepID=A0A565B351_9BRAS|nr:unnamed protein product [Arabis nemorensis]
MEISKVGCMSVGPCENLTPQNLLNALEPEEARGSSKKMNQEFVKEKPQGMAEDSSSTSETNVMVSENELDSTPILSVDLSLVRIMKESNSKLMEEEKQEQEKETVLMAAANKDKDIASTVVPEEDIKTKEDILVSISRSELKDHSFVSKLAEGDEAVESHATVFTTPEQVLLLGDSELYGAEKEEDHTATKVPDESDVLNATEKKCFMLGGSRKNEARNEGESTVVKLPDESNITTSPVRQFSVEDFKRDGIERNEENRTVNFSCEFGTCTSPDRRTVLGNLVSDGAEDSVGINRADKSDLLTSLEKKLFYGDHEQKEAVKTEEKAAAEFQHESAAVPNTPERQSILEDSQLNEAAKMKKGDYVIGKSHVVSDDFTAAESQSVVGDSEPDGAENICRENTDVESFDIGKSGLSHNASSSKVVLKENTIICSNDAGKEAAGTESQAEHVIGLDAIQGTKQSKRETVDLFAFDIQERETILRKSVKFPATSNFLEPIPWSGNNEADKLMETKESKNTQIGFEGNLLLESSGNSFVSEKTCIVAGFDSEVDDINTCEKSVRKSLENEATGPLATAFGEAISLTPDESTVQNNTNEEAADEQVIRRETTPSPEETMNEYPNTDESGTLSEKQVRREPLLIYQTQVKPNRNDMKENAPNSKIVHNLNITAPRISKRKPLQDLKKN